MREASASLKFALEFSSRDLIMMSDRSKRLTILFLWKVHIPHWSRLWTTGINPSAFRLKQSCITPWESLPILEREKPSTFFLVFKLKISDCKYLLLSAPSLIIISVGIAFLSSFPHHIANNGLESFSLKFLLVVFSVGGETREEWAWETISLLVSAAWHTTPLLICLLV